MNSRHLEQMLRKVFQDEGAVDAAGLARRAARDFELAERNEMIYQMRASMTEVEISHRFGISVRRVRQVVREQMDLHRTCA